MREQYSPQSPLIYEVNAYPACACYITCPLCSYVSVENLVEAKLAHMSRICTFNQQWARRVNTSGVLARRWQLTRRRHDALQELLHVFRLEMFNYIRWLQSPFRSMDLHGPCTLIRV